MADRGARVQNHALLYALLAGAAGTRPVGAAALRQAVRVYAEERGARMAARAARDGLARDAVAYLLYGEWQAPAEECLMTVTGYAPELRFQSERCPWFRLWRERGWLTRCRDYCELVDAHLARGFAAELVLDTAVCRITEGAPDRCDFVFPAHCLDEAGQAKFARNRERLGTRAKKDWHYHTAHLYAAFRRVFAQELGEAAAAQTCAEALDAYAAECGEAARARLLVDAAQDFTSIADYAGTPGLEP